jgi:hypothetical protein
MRGRVAAEKAEHLMLKPSNNVTAGTRTRENQIKSG